MISRTISNFFATLLIALTLVSCKENPGLESDITPEGTARLGTTNCDLLSYSDSLFYYNDKSSNNIEKPQARQNGTYGAFPAGLAINSSTGAIDVNKSESGLKYRVWFKAKGSADTCTQDIVISGINYRSQIYNLGSGQSIAAPFYNAAGNKTSPKDGSDFNDDNDDVAAFVLMKGKKRKPIEVEMDQQTGAINLVKSIKNGLFGEKPANGTSLEFRLYYRLNDASKKSLNYIDVRMHYYDGLANVPNSMLAQANYKTTANFRIATTAPGTMPNVAMANSTQDGEPNESRPTRPPDIIIVGR